MNDVDYLNIILRNNKSQFKHVVITSLKYLGNYSEIIVQNITNLTIFGKRIKYPLM